MQLLMNSEKHDTGGGIETCKSIFTVFWRICDIST